MIVMHVISASRRTDIPAHYSGWFRNRLEAGFAAYRNPFGGQIHRVSLQPEDVIAFLFWTRDATPFLPVLEELVKRGCKAAFQYTITGYGSPLEPGVSPTDRAARAFERLSDKLGPRFVRWRYDPIVLSRRWDRDYHLRRFESLLEQLEGKTDTCHTSFVQFYRKAERRFSRLAREDGEIIDERPDGEKIALARELDSLAASRGVRLVSCCYPLLDDAGIPRGRCVDPAMIRELRPDLADSALKLRPTRKGCGCAESRDIGAYDTCPASCLYCYATGNPEKARRRWEEHDPEAERLGPGHQGEHSAPGVTE